MHIVMELTSSKPFADCKFWQLNLRKVAIWNLNFEESSERISHLCNLTMLGKSFWESVKNVSNPSCISLKIKKIICRMKKKRKIFPIPSCENLERKTPLVPLLDQRALLLLHLGCLGLGDNIKHHHHLRHIHLGCLGLGASIIMIIISTIMIIASFIFNPRAR